MDPQENSVTGIFGKNVQKYRKKKNLNQNELAEKIGVSQKHLSDIETGTKFASAPIIEKLARELEVSVATLFDSPVSSLSIELSNRVAELVMANLQPKINMISNDLKDLKSMMTNLRITTDPT